MMGMTTQTGAAQYMCVSIQTLQELRWQTEMPSVFTCVSDNKRSLCVLLDGPYDTAADADSETTSNQPSN